MNNHLTNLAARVLNILAPANGDPSWRGLFPPLSRPRGAPVASGANSAGITPTGAIFAWVVAGAAWTHHYGLRHFSGKNSSTFLLCVDQGLKLAP